MMSARDCWTQLPPWSEYWSMNFDPYRNWISTIQLLLAPVSHSHSVAKLLLSPPESDSRIYYVIAPGCAYIRPWLEHNSNLYADCVYATGMGILPLNMEMASRFILVCVNHQGMHLNSTIRAQFHPVNKRPHPTDAPTLLHTKSSFLSSLSHPPPLVPFFVECDYFCIRKGQHNNTANLHICCM